MKLKYTPNNWQSTSEIIPPANSPKSSIAYKNLILFFFKIQKYIDN
jgi:hypothetical protein